MRLEEECRASRTGLPLRGDTELLYWSVADRSEVVVWTADAVEAVNAILQHYARVLQLRADEWRLFYRRLDEAAVTHLLTLAAEPRAQAATQVQLAWEQAHKNGHSGRILRQLAQAMAQVARQADSSALSRKDVQDVARQLWLRLQSEACLPQWAQMRRELDAICAEEIAAFRRGCGGLITEAQEKALNIVTARIAERMGEWVQRTSNREGEPSRLSPPLPPV